MLSPYDYEAILIGAVLRFGRQAALSVLPQLTADKFVYSFGGSLGGDDNCHIWRTIEETVLADRADPNLATGAIRLRLVEDLLAFAEGYANELIYKYRIERIDPETLRTYARRVHKQGIIYHYAVAGLRLGKLADPEAFAKIADKIEDAEQWGSQVISDIHSAGGDNGDARYVHVGEMIDDVQAVMEQQYSGEQTYLLPVGFPVLYSAGLLPAEALVVVHGLSSGGKSTLVHNVFNLGTAIGLVANNVKGCVAVNSLEMDRRSFIGRAASTLAGFNSFQLMIQPQSIKKDDFARYLEYVEFVGKLPLWLDDTPAIRIDTLRMRLMGVHLGQHGPVRQLSTDYLELFGDEKANESREQQISDLCAAHFTLRRELHACVIAVSQSTYNGKTFIAGMYGARYSKALTHKADVVIELVNYQALKRSGTDYIVAEGLDEEHVWLLLQKYRGGATNIKIALGWEADFTRLYDPSLVGIDANIVLFDHLEEVRKLLQKHPTTQIVPFADTPLSTLPTGDF